MHAGQDFYDYELYKLTLTLLLYVQIDLLNENTKFEREIREEQEDRKREEEEKKVRKAAFKEKATLFQQQME